MYSVCVIVKNNSSFNKKISGALLEDTQCRYTIILSAIKYRTIIKQAYKIKLKINLFYIITVIL